MFGILRPHRQQLERGEYVRYVTAYCSLCGLLRCQYGMASRMLVVHDIATLWWLLSSPSRGGNGLLKTNNCIRGGAGQLRRQGLSDLHRLLAALSVHMVAIKVADDLVDTGSWRSCLTGFVYHRVFQRARQDLVDIGFDMERLDTILSNQRELEQEGEKDFRVAAEPTAQAYGLVAREIAVRCATEFTPEQAEKTGRALGRAVYLVDAIRDFYRDRGTSFNSLCHVAEGEGPVIPESLRSDVLEFVGAHLSCGRQVAMDVAKYLGNSWRAIERAIFAGAGIHDEKNVTLYCGFCVPCGETKAYIDVSECIGCVCVLCCCCWCASHSGP